MTKKFINKSTFNDKWKIISNDLDSAFTVDGERAYSYLSDMDDEFVYFEVYDYNISKYTTWKAGYTFNGTSTKFAEGEAVEVVRTSVYVEVEKSTLEKTITKVLEKFLGKPQPRTDKFEGMEMKSLELLYIHPDSEDLVGDTISEETNKAMVESCNKAIEDGSLQPNLFHKIPAIDNEGDYLFEYTKSYILDEDLEVDGKTIKEGQSVVEVQWYSEKAYEMRMSGKLGAPSIGCMASVEVLDE